MIRLTFSHNSKIICTQLTTAVPRVGDTCFLPGSVYYTVTSVCWMYDLALPHDDFVSVAIGVKPL